MSFEIQYYQREGFPAGLTVTNSYTNSNRIIVEDTTGIEKGDVFEVLGLGEQIYFTVANIRTSTELNVVELVDDLPGGLSFRDLGGQSVQYVKTVDTAHKPTVLIHTAPSSASQSLNIYSPDIQRQWLLAALYEPDEYIELQNGAILRVDGTGIATSNDSYVRIDLGERLDRLLADNPLPAVDDEVIQATQEQHDDWVLSVLNTLYVNGVYSGSIGVTSESYNATEILRTYVYPGDVFTINGVDYTVFTVDSTNTTSTRISTYENPIDYEDIEVGAYLNWGGDFIMPGLVHINDLVPITPDNYTAYPLTGETDDIPIGNTITITATDEANNSVTATTLANEEGTWDVVLDLSALDNGDITFRAEAEDELGDVAYEELVGQKDIVIIPLAINDLAIIDNTSAINYEVSGVVGNHTPGDRVNVFIYDDDGNIGLDQEWVYINLEGEFRANIYNAFELQNGPIRCVVEHIDGDTDSVISTAEANTTKSVSPEISLSIDFPELRTVDNISAVELTGKYTGLAGGLYVNIYVENEPHLFLREVVATADDSGNFSHVFNFSGDNGRLIARAELAVNQALHDTSDAFMPEFVDFGPVLNHLNDIYDDFEASEYMITGQKEYIGSDMIISILATDISGNEVSADASNDYIGPETDFWSLLDLSMLSDGPIEITASYLDKSDSKTIRKGMSFEYVMLDELEDISYVNASEYIVTGTSEGLMLGTSVNATITDSFGNTINATGQVVSGGGFSITFDASTLENGTATVEVSATDYFGNELTDSTTVNIDIVPAGIITLFGLDAIDYNNDTAYSVSGGTSEIVEGETVSISITDSVAGSVSGSALVGVDGSWSDSLDVSVLADGALTVEVSVVDQRSETRMATDTVQKDSRLPGSISITGVPALINKSNVNAVAISGTTTNTLSGQVVNVEIGDGANTVFATAEVQADGSWTATLDVSMLVDGELTVDAVVTDQLGAQQTATSTTQKDTIPSGSITLDTIEEIDYNNDTAYLVSGSSEDLPEGYEVNVVIEDDIGGMVVGVVHINEDGSWEAEMDVSGLADGAIYVTVNATDQRGDLVSDQDDTVKDSRLPGSIAITQVPDLISKDNVNQVVISGTTTNTPESNVVNVEIGDGANTVFATAEVKADGSWTATLDVESLADGVLTITADVDDQRGDIQVAGTQVEKDALWPGSISISIGSTSNISAVVVSGATEWVDAGSTVSLDVLDGAGATHSFTATTDAQGDYQSTLNLAAIADGTFTITARAVDETGEVVEASAQAQKRTSVEQGGEIYLSAEVIGKHNVEAFSVWGSTVNVPAGQSVTILAEDATGKAISTTASVGSNGEYSTTLNATGLADGTLTIVATTTDEIGGSISASTQVEKDALHPGTITVSAENVGKHNVSALVVSGETTNTPAGNVVSITATDSEGLIATAEAEVMEDGSYEATLDLNSLSDGELVILSTVEDETEATISTSVSIEKDALHPGTITVEAPTVGKDNVNEVSVFGDLVNVPAGSEVWVTAEDSSGSQVSGYALSEADSYDLKIDVYGLADGTLTITASTTDETGAEISATTQVEKDALHPGTISVSMAEVTYHNYNNVQLTGTTVNVYAGQQVSIDITDHAGNSVSDTATIQDDGTFIRSLDLTELADGTLTVSVSVMDETEEVITASTQVSKETVSQDDFTLSNLQTHYGRNFPTGITEGQFAIAKNHTLNYVRTFLNAAKLEYDMQVYAYIKEAVWDIAHYKIWLNVGTPSESVTLKNERAIEWLKDIAKGNVRVKLPEKESRKKGFHTIMLLR